MNVEAVRVRVRDSKGPNVMGDVTLTMEVREVEECAFCIRQPQRCTPHRDVAPTIRKDAVALVDLLQDVPHGLRARPVQVEEHDIRVGQSRRQALLPLRPCALPLPSLRLHGRYS